MGLVRSILLIDGSFIIGIILVGIVALLQRDHVKELF
jgi:hypothetical protein